MTLFKTCIWNWLFMIGLPLLCGNTTLYMRNGSTYSNEMLSSSQQDPLYPPVSVTAYRSQHLHNPATVLQTLTFPSPDYKIQKLAFIFFHTSEDNSSRSFQNDCPTAAKGQIAGKEYCLHNLMMCFLGQPFLRTR